MSINEIPSQSLQPLVRQPVTRQGETPLTAAPGDVPGLQQEEPVDVHTAAVPPDAEKHSTVETEAMKSPAAEEKPAPAHPAAQEPSPVTLTILYNNDLHGYIEEHEPEGDENIVGGFARTAAKIREERSKDPDKTITLEGGDFFDGGFYSKMTNGAIVADAYRETGFDAIVVGNHDMGWGRKALKEITDRAGADVLANNINDLTKDGTLAQVKPYKIIERGGMKIGIIGTTSPDTALCGPDRKTFRIEDPAAKTKQTLQELKEKEKVDMVILLSHLGEQEDIKLAEQVKGIDVIVGSHSHTAVRTPENVGGTLIVQAGGEGDYLGRLQVSYDPKSHTITESKGELIPITADIAPDPAVEKVMAPYMEELRPLREKVLGYVDQDLVMFDRSLKPTNLTNLYIDAQRKDSDVAIGGMFSLRNGISKGAVTAYDLFTTYPFEDKLLQVETKGANVLRFLEGGLPDKGFNDVHVLFSGLSFDYDMTLPENQRITSVEYKGKRYPRSEFERLPMKVSMDTYTQSQSYFKDDAVTKKFGKVFDVLQEHFTTPGALANLSSEPRCFCA